jgi:hypothetical protein
MVHKNVFYWSKCCCIAIELGRKLLLRVHPEHGTMFLTEGDGFQDWDFEQAARNTFRTALSEYPRLLCSPVWCYGSDVCEVRTVRFRMCRQEIQYYHLVSRIQWLPKTPRNLQRIVICLSKGGFLD